MRILQVIPSLSKGGAERVVVELSNSLIDLQNQVTILLAQPVPAALNQNDLNEKVAVQFVNLQPINRYMRYLQIPFWVFRNWKTLKKYDVIHCHLTYGLFFGFIISCSRRFDKRSNVRLVATCHVIGVGTSTFTKLINEKLSGFFDAFVLMAIDDAWRDFIKRKKARRNIHIVVNGIDPKSFSTGSPSLTRRSIHTVGTISRLQAERKPWLFLQTFAKIQELTKTQCRFIIGGEGPERTRLESIVEELRLGPTLSMMGFIQSPIKFLESLDLYVSLNVEDVTGIAGLEAVFSGIPVVGIQLSQSYVCGPNDWIWSNQDPNKVAQKIVTILGDPKELKDLSDRQYKIAHERYSIMTMSNKYLMIYRGMLDSGSAT
jgi:glycosyltransferase involved in cell wall biosynthesis